MKDDESDRRATRSRREISLEIRTQTPENDTESDALNKSLPPTPVAIYSPHRKRLNDQLLDLEFQLLDALEDAGSSGHAAKSSRLSASTNSPLSFYRSQQQQSSNSSSLHSSLVPTDQILLRNSCTSYSAQAAAQRTTLLTFHDYSQQRHLSCHQRVMFDRKRFRSEWKPRGLLRVLVYSLIFIGLFITVAVLLAIFVPCSQLFGCQPEILYQEVLQLTSHTVNGTRYNLFGPEIFAGYGYVSGLQRYLVSTLPRNSSGSQYYFPGQLGAVWALVNISDAATAAGQGKSNNPLGSGAFPATSPPDSTVSGGGGGEMASEDRSDDFGGAEFYGDYLVNWLGRPICGRLVPFTPLFGFISTIAAERDHSRTTVLFHISNHTNTMANTANANSSSSTSATWQANELAYCCVEFYYKANGFSRVWRSDVHSRVICGSGPDIGGRWQGWTSIVRWPTASAAVASKSNDSTSAAASKPWVLSVNTGASAGVVFSKGKASTLISVSTYAGNGWRRTLSLTTAASMPLSTFPWLNKTLGLVPSTSLANFSLTAQIPFENDFSFNYDRSEFNLAFDNAELDFSRLLPSPWLFTPCCGSTDSMQVFLRGYRRPSTALALFNQQTVRLSNANGCPDYGGYQPLSANNSCMRPQDESQRESDQWPVSLRVNRFRDSIFSAELSPGESAPVPATIIRLTGQLAAASSSSLEGQSVAASFRNNHFQLGGETALTGYPIKLQLFANLSQINKRNQLPSCWLMIDGAKRDQTLKVYKTDPEYLGGGDWAEIRVDWEMRAGWLPQLPYAQGFMALTQVLSTQLSLRTGSVLLAFDVTDQRQLRGLFLAVQLAGLNFTVPLHDNIAISSAADSIEESEKSDQQRFSDASLLAAILKRAMANQSLAILPPNFSQYNLSDSIGGASDTTAIQMDYTSYMDGVALSGINAGVSDEFLLWQTSDESLELFGLPIGDSDIVPTAKSYFGSLDLGTRADDEKYRQFQKQLSSKVSLARELLSKPFIQSGLGGVNGTSLLKSLESRVKQIIIYRNDGRQGDLASLISDDGWRSCQQLIKDFSPAAGLLFSNLMTNYTKDRELFDGMLSDWMVQSSSIPKDVFPKSLKNLHELIRTKHWTAKQFDNQYSATEEQNPLETTIFLSTLDIISDEPKRQLFFSQFTLVDRSVVDRIVTKSGMDAVRHLFDSDYFHGKRQESLLLMNSTEYCFNWTAAANAGQNNTNTNTNSNIKDSTNSNATCCTLNSAVARQWFSGLLLDQFSRSIDRLLAFSWSTPSHFPAEILVPSVLSGMQWNGELVFAVVKQMMETKLHTRNQWITLIYLRWLRRRIVQAAGGGQIEQRPTEMTALMLQAACLDFFSEASRPVLTVDEMRSVWLLEAIFWAGDDSVNDKQQRLTLINRMAQLSVI